MNGNRVDAHGSIPERGEAAMSSPTPGEAVREHLKSTAERNGH
jgi:hypothetical protein